MAALQHFAREGAWICTVPGAPTDAIGDPKDAQAVIEEEGILATLLDFRGVRDAAATKHDVQASGPRDREEEGQRERPRHDLH